jgi:sialate O-acetylesterase
MASCRDAFRSAFHDTVPHRSTRRLFAHLLLFSIAATPGIALELASPFTAHAVLQRDVAVPIWGTAEAGERITVAFAGQTKTTVADSEGNWRITLDALPAAATPRRLAIRGALNDTLLEVEDIVVGDVWLMAGPPPPTASPADERREEDAPVGAPRVRLFMARPARAYEPQPSVEGAWQSFGTNSPAPAAAAFAADLQRDIGVPVGVIVLPASGAPPIWMRREAIAADPALKPTLDAFDARVKAYSPPTEDDFKRWQKAKVAPKPVAKGKKRPPFLPPRGDPVQFPQSPTVAFNAMVAPLVGDAIRGFLWRPDDTGLAVGDIAAHWDQLLIADWRSAWQPSAAERAQRPLPFFFAEFGGPRDRDRLHAMETAALRLAATGRVITMDLHPEAARTPEAERTTGERFARLAAALAYGQTIEYSGPELKSVSSFGGALQLHFTHADGGLVGSDEALTAFAVAGPNGVFHRANGHIDGATVYVSNPEVAVPVRIRYAWTAEAAAGGWLYNRAGLPAAAFEANAPDP